MQALATWVGLLICLLIAVVFYFLGKKIAPPSEENPEKTAPYACGEDYPPEKIQMYIHNFYYIAFFVLFEIATLILALSMFSFSFYVVAAYAIIVFLTLLQIPRW
ncbi:MAG: NADH-quinone oxidoreductase subunit A [Candidatus Odinarchaeota archaeon]|nr:NADH-quinone oxidoreductase subunit A [Candidatus Odinarchaeota archaeon]